MANLKSRAQSFYEAHETKVDIAFFLGGFFFDVATLSDVDDLFGIVQQIVYLFAVGIILYFEFLSQQNLVQISPKLQRVWNYRQLVVHFLLGSLLSVYSLFYLKSASLFSSIAFVLLLLGLMVANEIKSVQESRINIRLGLFVICLFSFFSMTIPVLLGFVGLLPFLLSVGLTGAVLYGVFYLLYRRAQNIPLLTRELLAPGFGVLVLFFVFYFIGWIPPVPLSVQNMGIYHNVEKVEGQYRVSHERPWWKIWHTGDQDFKAEPGDKIYIFAQIYSPARFSDSVLLNWAHKHPQKGWQGTDQIAMRIAGGRKQGYRGYASKQNYSEGEWRVSVTTTDGREIGRIHFTVTKTPEASPSRVFIQETF